MCNSVNGKSAGAVREDGAKIFINYTAIYASLEISFRWISFCQLQTRRLWMGARV